jgi:hypothetical protein
MPGWNVPTAILRHPEGARQPDDQQTEHREEDLLHHGAWNDGLRVSVDDRYLDDLPADHDEAHRRREEHGPFALDELRGCSEQHPAPNDNQEDQARDGVVAERRAGQPGNGELLVKRPVSVILTKSVMSLRTERSMKMG